MDLKTALHNLESQEYFVWDDFLSLEEVRAVSLDYQSLYEKGSFRLAGTGREKSSRSASAGIRSDETLWLEPLNLTPAQMIFWQRLETLKNEINESAFLGLWSLEGHYSRYPVNGQYQKHLDRFSANDERTISMVLYLNEAWGSEDGGDLRLHFPKQKPSAIDIAPQGGRLVCFLSASVLHEVMPSYKIRKSFCRLVEAATESSLSVKFSNQFK